MGLFLLLISYQKFISLKYFAKLGLNDDNSSTADLFATVS